MTKRMVFMLCIVLFCFHFGSLASGKERREMDFKPIVSAAIVKPKRDFGYFLSDLATISYQVILPDSDLLLNITSLPKNDDTIAFWLEVRNLHVKETRERQSKIYILTYTFQIFTVKPEPSAVEIPAIEFFYGTKETPSAYLGQLPAVQMTVSPLTYEGAEFKPLILESIENPLGIYICGAGIIILASCCACSIFFAVKFFFAPSPFKEALGEIAGIPQDNSSIEKVNLAFRIFHESLNRKLGEAFFPYKLGVLFEILPKAKACQEEIVELLATSEKIYFAEQKQADPHDLLKRITSILRTLRWCEIWRT